MKAAFLIAQLTLIAIFPNLSEQLSLDDKAASQYYRERAERRHVRDILAARQDCGTVDCMEGGDGDCSDAGCNVCSHTYYCTGPDDRHRLPTVEEMVVIAGSSDIKDKPAVLTNFLEADHLKNKWADHICKQITSVPSDQDIEAGSWFYSIQGTHKRAMSLTHNGEFLTVLATWEPSEKRLLPMFEDMKVDLCRKAIQAASENVHNLEYGAFGLKSVRTAKNRHAISISTPPTGAKSKRGRSGNTIAFINIELGDHNKEVGLFNGNGLP